MERFLDMPCDPSQLSPLTLAFVGDTVYDLFIREKLVCLANRPVKKLHNLAASRVNAASQAKSAKMLFSVLTEEELSVLKKGRNAHNNHKAKNMSESDYHMATGFETLFGWLYLSGKIERLRELFAFLEAEAEKED